MKIQIEKVLKNNICSVTISILNIEDSNYLEAISDFGEKPINFGGIIKSSEDEIVATLADRTIKITDLVKNPITQTFSVNQYGDNATIAANSWASESATKIEEYVKEVCSKIDSFTSTEIIDV